MRWLYLESIAYGLLHPEQLRGLQAVISSLADPALRQQAQRQLEQQQQQGQRLTLSQLLRCCHFHIIRQASAKDTSPLELPALREAAGVSGLAVSQLDPTNPKSHAAEADADRLVGGSRPGQASSNVERHLRAWPSSSTATTGLPTPLPAHCWRRPLPRPRLGQAGSKQPWQPLSRQLKQACAAANAYCPRNG